MDTTPVTFEDVTIHRATILPKKGECNAKGFVSREAKKLEIFDMRLLLLLDLQ